MNNNLLIYENKKRKITKDENGLEEDINIKRYREEQNNYEIGMRAIRVLSEDIENKEQERIDIINKQESENNELLERKDSLDIRDFESALDYQKERSNIDLLMSWNDDEGNKLESEIKSLKDKLKFMESWVEGVFNQRQSAKDVISIKSDSININI